MAGFFLLAVVVGSGLLLFVYPRWRRKRLLARAFPREWENLLQRRLPFLSRLSAGEQQQLRDLIRLFLADKQFHGCNGQLVDDEVRLVIAALACILLLNRPTDLYPRLGHILVYPDTFVARRDELNDDGTMSSVERELSGESWETGKIVLAWQDVEDDLADPGSGFNVVWHEFAHQLDGEDGTVNGAPAMAYQHLGHWAELFTQEYAALQDAVEHGWYTFLDPYGASNPAEFFAVVTECYFDNPLGLEQHHPQLHAALQGFFRTDPRPWQRASRHA